MKLTPLDIQQQQFRTAIAGGFDKKEVDAFLDLLANDVEELIRQNNSLREEVKRKDAEIQEHQERERTLKETMLTATRITEDIKHNARKEAEIVLSTAESHAEQIVQNAHTRLVRIMEDIDELKRQKAQFEASLRSVISTHTKLLDAMSEREVAETEASLSLMRRKGAQRPVQVVDVEMESAIEASGEEPKVLAMRDNTVRTPILDEDLLTPRGGDR